MGFIEELKTTGGNEGVSKTLFHYSFIRENRFNPFNSVPLATLHFEVS